MTVSPRTAAQFITDLQTALASRTTSYDYTTGPIYDTWVYPPGVVMEAMQNRLREVSLILSLENVDQFARTDVEPIFYNEGVVLSDGGQATGTLVCFRNTLPSADIVIPIGFPVATAVDGSTAFISSFGKPAAGYLHFVPIPRRYREPPSPMNHRQRIFLSLLIVISLIALVGWCLLKVGYENAGPLKDSQGNELGFNKPLTTELMQGLVAAALNAGWSKWSRCGWSMACAIMHLWGLFWLWCWPVSWP